MKNPEWLFVGGMSSEQWRKILEIEKREKKPFAKLIAESVTLLIRKYDECSKEGNPHEGGDDRRYGV